jgi:hypothetical protein
MNRDGTNKQKFAVFDIDGTIARTGLFFQVIDELIAAGHLPRESRSELDKNLNNTETANTTMPTEITYRQW